MNRPAPLLALALLASTSAASEDLRITPAPPAAAPAAALPSPANDAPAKDALPEGRALLAKFRALSVLDPKAASIRNAIVTSTYAVDAQGISGTIVIAYARPGKVCSIAEMKDIGRIEQCYDGKIGWESNPLSGSRRLSDAEISQLQDSDDNVLTVTEIESRYRKAETLARTTFAGKDAYEVRLVTTSGQESTAYFDAATGLLIGSKATVASELGSIPAEITLSDYKAFGPLRLPATSSQSLMGGVVKATSSIVSIEYDVAPDRLPSFVPPADLAPPEEAATPGQ